MHRLAILLGLVVAAPAAADEPPPRHAQAPAHNPAECHCRADGRMMPLGERICLKTAEGPRLAECRMDLNVTSWVITRTPCPES